MSRNFFSKYFRPAIIRSKIADRRKDNIRHIDKTALRHHDESLQKTWSFRVPPISSLKPDQWKSVLWKHSEQSSFKLNDVQDTPQKHAARSNGKSDVQKISVSPFKESAPNYNNPDLFKAQLQKESGDSFHNPDSLKVTYVKNYVHSSNSADPSDDSPLKESAQSSPNQDLLKITSPEDSAQSSQNLDLLKVASLEDSGQSSRENPDVSKIVSPKKSLWHSLNPNYWKSKIMKNSSQSSYNADISKSVSLKYSAQSSSKTQISDDSPRTDSTQNSQSQNPKDSPLEDSTQSSDKLFFLKMASLKDSLWNSNFWKTSTRRKRVQSSDKSNASKTTSLKEYIQNILGSNLLKTSRSQTSSSDSTFRQRVRKSLDIKTECHVRSTTGAPASIFIYHLADIWCWFQTDIRQVPSNGSSISVMSLSRTGVKVAVAHEVHAGDKMVVCDIFKVTRGDTFNIQEMTTGSGVTKYEGGQPIANGKVIRVDSETVTQVKKVLKIAVPYMSVGMTFPQKPEL